VRELQSALKQALVQTNSPILAPESLAAVIPAAAHRVPTPAPPADAVDSRQFLEQRLRAGTENLYAEWLALTERDLLTRVLRHTGWNQVRAAKTLGINRSTLRAKIASLGIVVGERSARSPAGEPG
jgi:two-component system nitrogen regulation response regulator GlnG